MAVVSRDNRVENSYENSILGIVRDAWRKSVPEHQKRDGTVEAIVAHSGRMGKILGATAEYDAICIPNILEHMKYMSLPEARSYMHVLERLGYVYKRAYGSYVASLLMIGVSKKARDTSGASRHLEYIVDRISKKSKRYERLSNKEATMLRALSARRYVKSKSLIGRLFGKGEIALLDTAIMERKERIRGHTMKMAKYSEMINGSAGRPSDSGNNGKPEANPTGKLPNGLDQG